MAEPADRPKRPGTPRNGSRPGSNRPAKGTPPGSGKPRRDGAPRDSDDRPRREGGPRRGDGRPERREGRDGHGGHGRDGDRLWTREGRPARGDASARHGDGGEEERERLQPKQVRARHDDPPIPDEVTPKDLDRIAYNQLKTLTAENAEEVARHLAMAGMLIDEDPELAHQHAISASLRAGRIAVVRETLAITAYTIGDYALALREFRTYRRISGRDDQLPMMVDSERGLGRPERALELGRSVDRAALPAAVQVELAIAMSGARLDLGQTEAALVELEIPQLDPDRAFSYSPGLFSAYAVVLEDLGRHEEAKAWFDRADVATSALMAATDEEESSETVQIEEEPLDSDD